MYSSIICIFNLGKIGRKGIEPSTALAIEFTAQPIIPTNGTFLYLFEEVLLMFIKPVQFPLHEPYFDLTLIRTAHTKNPTITFHINPIIHLRIIRKQTYCTSSFQHATSG